MRGLTRKQQVLEMNLSDLSYIILCFRKNSLLKGKPVEQIQIIGTDLMVTTQDSCLDS